MRNKNASMVHQVIVHLILIGLIFALFFVAMTYRTNSRGVKQQVLEKQTALLIDAAEPGVSLRIEKQGGWGEITKMEIKDGRIFAYVDNQGFSKGYPYFTKYDISLDSDSKNYYVGVG